MIFYCFSPAQTSRYFSSTTFQVFLQHNLPGISDLHSEASHETTAHLFVILRGARKFIELDRNSLFLPICVVENKNMGSSRVWCCEESWSALDIISPLTPNDHYSGRTAPLTSKCYILYDYSTNICTEYLKYGIYFSKCSLVHNFNVFSSCFIHISYTGELKLKKKKFRCQEVKRGNQVAL